MKIVYCTDTVCYPGGIQMVTMVKANALAKIPGNQVWIVVTDHKKEPLIPLENVELVNLDVNYYEDDWKGGWYVLKGIFQKRKIHKRRLLRFLNEIDPDIVVSTGTSEKNFLPTMSVKSSPVFIREIHFEKNYRKRAAKGWKGLLFAHFSDWYDYGYKIKKYNQIVVLTEEDRLNNWKGCNKVTVMPNPKTANANGHSNCQKKKAIAAGRLVPQKNFVSLIRCWRIVVDRFPDWCLEIWGTGIQENLIKEEVKNLQLEENVCLKGFTSDIYSKMRESSMYLMTSEFEGFPLVLIEAMSTGLPVVSYACPTGPKDIIDDGKNGFLVPVNDEDMFAEKICVLIENEPLRKKMGQEALSVSQRYEIDTIIPCWMTLFQNLKTEKC